jgi:hypothetical protein
MYEYVGSVFSFVSPDFRSVSFIQLRPNSDGETPLSWNHSMDFGIRGYTTDPAQGITVIVEASPEQ